MTTIKYDAGTPVFWLSSRGFKKGVIKSVLFRQDRIIGGRIDTELIYRLSDDPDSVYMGDDVKEHLIFVTYEAVLEHYKNNPVFTS